MMSDPTGTYLVGYGKPPAARQFRKGQSGNPRGRPRGAAKPANWLDPSNQPSDMLILEEAYRTVTVREGDKAIELPVVQAAMRALGIAAMKGSRLAQVAFADIVRTIEERKATEQRTILDNALNYKLRWTEELQRRQQQGLVAPDPVPHPDDIVINWRTGHVRTEGPLDEQEKFGLEELLSRRAEAQDELNSYAQLHRKARTAQAKANWLELWHSEQSIFDLINDGVPGRYKAKLANRSCRDGASREGHTLEEYRKKRKAAAR